VPGGFFALMFYRPGLIESVAAAPTGFWLALAGLVLFCTVIAQLGWFWVLQHVEAGPTAISTYTIPIFSLVYSWAWLGEAINIWTALAAAGIVAGVLISGLELKSREEKP
jgi:drug/metabolite transporter (DMT)-like permease